MPNPDPPSSRTELVAWLIGPAFVVLAAWMFIAAPDAAPPLEATPLVLPEEIDPSPLRTALADPAIVRIGGFDQRCNACHKLFETTWDGTRPLLQHTHVEMKHGINAGCLNCHDRADRERLVLHDGSTVPFSDVAQLCRQCHGPIYRDWVRGVHGKTLGGWSAELAQPRKLICSECHEPHAPAYDPIRPLPGPNTLRMGKPDSAAHAMIAEERNPLRLWATVEHEGGTDGHAGTDAHTDADTDTDTDADTDADTDTDADADADADTDSEEHV